MFDEKVGDAMGTNSFPRLLDSSRFEAVLELEHGRKHDNEWTAAFQFIARPAVDGRVRYEPHDDEQQQQHFEYDEGAAGDSLLRRRSRRTRPVTKTT